MSEERSLVREGAPDNQNSNERCLGRFESDTGAADGWIWCMGTRLVVEG